jgi:uncharacterized membrane protein
MTVTSSSRREWLVPAGLILLSFVPVTAGALRVAQLTGGAEVTSENARFFAMPVPVLVHIPSASLYLILGAFQFVPSFRRRRLGWHRAAGRLLVPCGLSTALSGLWMTVSYHLPASDDALLEGFRIVFGLAMILSIVLGFAAIRRRDIARHRAWMMRGYAIGMGAGTQVLTNLPWILAFGQPAGVSRALLIFAGWAINLAVAEWFIRSRPTEPTRTPAGRTAALGLASR